MIVCIVEVTDAVVLDFQVLFFPSLSLFLLFWPLNAKQD